MVNFLGSWNVIAFWRTPFLAVRFLKIIFKCSTSPFQTCYVTAAPVLLTYKLVELLWIGSRIQCRKILNKTFFLKLVVPCIVIQCEQKSNRCNSMQTFIHWKTTLHVSGVTAPIIRSIKNCTRSLRYKSYYLYRYSPPTQSWSDHVGGE